jgi:hypothetical protein
MKTKENYDQLIAQINVFIRKYYFNNFLRGLIFLGAGLFSAYVLITVSEYFGNFNIFFRSLLFYFFIVLNVGLIGWLIIPSTLALLKLRTPLTHDQAAEIIGRHFSTVNDKLLNTLQLKKLAIDDPGHLLLIEASIDQRIAELKPFSFRSAINIKENIKFIKWALFPAAVICVIGLSSPSVLTESTKRLIRHNEYFAPVAPFSFIVENKSLTVLQGDNFKLDLKLEGDKFPSDVYIETGNNTFKVDKDNISHFHYLFTNQQQNTSFRVSANGFTSKLYEVKVTLRPVLLHFDVALTYPAYLHKKNETLPNAGDLNIPEGTSVKWIFHTQNTNALLFNINNRPAKVKPVSADVFECGQRIVKNAVYTVSPLNINVAKSDSATYRINVIADEPPTISVQEKPDSVSMKAIYFDGQIQDDHGFSSLTFHYEVGKADDKAHLQSFIIPMKANLNQTQSSFFYFWNLKALGIKPGEQITYFFEVADNDDVNGPKKVRSTEHTLNVPDANQLNKELNSGTQAIKQKMESAIKIAAQIEHDSQKINQLLLNKKNLSFDEKRQIEDLLQKRAELDELVKDIQAENKKNQYNRQENQTQGEQLTEKQKQIENLLNSMLDPKTAEMMQRLKDMLEQEQKEGTRDELSKMQMDNKSLKKELDRMIELYKKLDFEQKLNQNINQLNQLSQDQQKLADQAKQTATEEKTNEQQKPADQSKQVGTQEKTNEQQKPADQSKQVGTQEKTNEQQKPTDQSKPASPEEKTKELQKEQQKLNSGFDSLKKSLDDLEKVAEKIEHNQNFENPTYEEQSIKQKMEQSSDELKKNNNSKASEKQKQAATEMKELADKMQRHEQEGQEAENNINAQQLRELLKALINSSFEQEKVMQTLKTTNPTDPNYILLAQNQKNIKDNLKTAEDSLTALSMRVPQIQSTINKEITSINSNIDQALESLGERRTPEATKDQQYAMTSMNNLALMLSEVLDQLQKEMGKGGKGKGKGTQQSIGQLAKMQYQLNQNMQKAREQMQQHGNDNKGQKEDNGKMSEQLAKLAREQQFIRESLQKINMEENKDGRGGLGNLDKISQEMEQNEHDIVNKTITNESIKRQEEIKTRLLEADKAEQEREQDQQRESNAGKDTPPGLIKALQQYQQLNQKQTEQVKTIPSSLNLYYKTRVKSYYDFLNLK